MSKVGAERMKVYVSNRTGRRLKVNVRTETEETLYPTEGLDMDNRKFKAVWIEIYEEEEKGEKE